MNEKEFVCLTQTIEDLEINSIGIIQEQLRDKYLVYFIGKDKVLKLPKEKIKKVDIYKTGKGYDKKICNICHVLKSMDEFDKNQTDAKGRFTTRPSCKECRKDIDGLFLLKEEKEKIDKIKPQKGSVFVCPVCNKRSIVGVTANLVRDHSHATGKARDWICDSCNTGLGRFKDDIKMFEKIIEYLRKFED